MLNRKLTILACHCLRLPNQMQPKTLLMQLPKRAPLLSILEESSEAGRIAAEAALTAALDANRPA